MAERSLLEGVLTLVTRTISPADVLTIPGDIPGVLAGYVGPGILRGKHTCAVIGQTGAGPRVTVTDRDSISYLLTLEGVPVKWLSLPLSSSFFVAAHLVDWLARGERCPGCPPCTHKEGYTEPDTNALICRRCEDGEGCPCKGTGYLRPPADLFWALKPETFGGPPKWIARAVTWASVVRAAAGLPPIDEVDGLWVYAPGASWTWHRRPLLTIHSGRIGVLAGGYDARRFGAEEADKEQQDAGALHNGWALLDNTPSGLVLRVAVPE